MVVRAGAPCTEALDLNAVFKSLSSVLSDLCFMSIPVSLSPFCAIPLSNKVHQGHKTFKKISCLAFRSLSHSVFSHNSFQGSKYAAKE